jgi:hypothetical protein
MLSPEWIEKKPLFIFSCDFWQIIKAGPFISTSCAVGDILMVS